VGNGVEVGSTKGAPEGVGETIGRAVTVGPMISITGVLDTLIVGTGAGGATQLLINPALKISISKVFISSPLIVEPQQFLMRIILYGGTFADP
jgi:hypothetical protein